MFRNLIAAAAMILGAVTAAQAATTYNVVGSFSGGQLGTVSFDVTFTADLSQAIDFGANGLVTNSLTSSVVGGDPFAIAGGGLGFRNSFTQGFIISGLANTQGVNDGTTDFIFQVDNVLTNPNVFAITDSISSTAGFGSNLEGSATFSIREVNPVPVPAGLTLALTGFTGLGAMALRRRRKMRT